MTLQANEDLGRGIKVKISEHESGDQKTYFSCFDANPISKAHFDEIFEATKNTLGATKITQVYLKVHQEDERRLLVEMGFAVDGIKYRLDTEKLSKIAHVSGQKLADKYEVRALNFAQDIDAIIQLEKSIHAADKTSRVNFDTAASIGSMKNYYRRISADGGAFVLSNHSTIVGIVGFIKSPRETGEAEISSVGLDLSVQGKSLFFPFLHEAFLMSPFKDSKALTGVTTTSRLIAASEKYQADVIGYLLSRNC